MVNFDKFDEVPYLHDDTDVDAMLADFFVNLSQKNLPAVINAENQQRFHLLCSDATRFVRNLVPNAEIKVSLGGIFNLCGIWECTIPEFGFTSSDKDEFIALLSGADTLSIGASNDGCVQIALEVRNVFDLMEG